MALQSSPETPQPLARVVGEVKAWVGRLGAIWVDAQIIELRRRAGAVTHFLTLRDRFAEVSANVTCSTLVLDSAGPLTEGSQVVALVRPRVWDKNSSLTFECLEVRMCGEGQLLAELEQRKRLLQAEGLFDQARKRRLPFLPRTVGLIAGDRSDAERDVRVNIQRRWPGMIVRHVPAIVQGPRCAESVIAALAELDDDSAVDVIVIARGGGSLEDLLGFSDEGLVRAVAEALTPVVSAIGHEADTPLLDFVADVRASTPTDAAKRVVPDAAAEIELMQRGRRRIRAAIDSQVQTLTRDLADVRSRPSLRDPLAAFDAHHERLGHLHHRLGVAIDRTVNDEQIRLRHALASVRTMSPKATLERGYAIVIDASGATVTAADDAAIGDELFVHLAAGALGVQVNKREIVERQPAPEHVDLTRGKNR